jgi:hypothetical protein
MSTPRSCLYCNALLPPGAEACPVCGERVPGAPGAITNTPPTPTTSLEKDTATRRLPNRQVGFLIVGGMVFCAMVALGYALWTQSQRRDNDAGLPPRPHQSPFGTPGRELPAVVLPPEQLAALRYLPAGVDVIAGVHFAALLDDPAAKPLLDQPLPVGPVTLRLADLHTWTGLDPKALDHAVIGVTLPRGGIPIPRVVFVFRTRRAYNADAVKLALHPEADRDKPTLWTVRLGKVDFPVSLWLADDRTLVLGLTSADLADLPAPGSDKLTHLPETVRTLLRERVEPGSAAWAVGRLRDGLGGVVGLAAKPTLERMKLTPEQREAVEGIESFAAGVVPGQEIVCRLNVECAKASAAERVAGLFQGPNLKVVPDSVWVLVQWKTTLERLTRGLER